MLQLSSTIINQAVLSLRTGGQVALATEPLINPNNLKIEGFYCADHFDKNQLILLTQDIRDHVEKGFVIDDHEVLADPEELVRLKEVLDLRFELVGKSVVTVNKQRLGKVSDYAVDDSSLYIQKIYVSPQLIKSLSGGNLSIDRSQIVEISDRKIIVQELLNPLKDPIASTVAMPAG